MWSLCFKLLAVAVLLTWPLKTFGKIEIEEDRDLEAFSRTTSAILQKTVNEFKTVAIRTYPIYTTQFNQEINGIMKHAKDDLIFEINFVKSKYDTQERSSGVCLILVESPAKYKEEAKHLESIIDLGALIIYYVKSMSPSDILKFHQEQKVSQPKMYFIVDTEKYIELIVIVQYTATACDQTQLTVINRYSKQLVAWEASMPPITNDLELHSCTVHFKFFGPLVGVQVTEQNADGQVKIKGPFAEIFNQIAKHSNINAEFTSNEGFNFNKYKFILFATLSTRGIEMFPFYHAEIFFVVPEGELYCDWELLTLAFDAITWLLIGITFGATFTFIVIIKLSRSTTVRNFVFGRNVSSPALNVLVLFFGLSQVVLPRRNFARFLTAMFIIWCLIIRTCYQGKHFEYLQGDMRKPEIQSFEELMRHNFSFYAHSVHAALIQMHDEKLHSNIEATWEKHNHSNLDWKNIIDDYMKSPTTNILIADTFQIIDYHSNKSNKPWLIMKERYMNFYGGFGFYQFPNLNLA